MRELTLGIKTPQLHTSYGDLLTVWQEHCAAVGRNVDEIELSAQVWMDFDDLGQGVWDGQELVDAGVTQVVPIVDRHSGSGCR